MCRSARESEWCSDEHLGGMPSHVGWRAALVRGCRDLEGWCWSDMQVVCTSMRAGRIIVLVGVSVAPRVSRVINPRLARLYPMCRAGSSDVFKWDGCVATDSSEVCDMVARGVFPMWCVAKKRRSKCIGTESKNEMIPSMLEVNGHGESCGYRGRCTGADEQDD